MAVDLMAEPVNVEPMAAFEARQLLAEQIGNNFGEEEAMDLFKELEFLPLAISQAAAFMQKRRNTITTVAQYLDLYRQSDKSKIQLLSHNFVSHGPGRETRVSESVIKTWLISFEHIRQENPKATDLLSLMSFLDRQGIPRSLLTLPTQEFDIDIDFIEAMGMLEAYSLVLPMHEGKSFDVHRLVQLATRTWININSNESLQRSDERAFQALEILSTRFPPATNMSWEICAKYLPHAEAVLQYKYQSLDSRIDRERAALLRNVASYLEYIGNNEGAASAKNEAQVLYQRHEGPDHTPTI